MDTKNFSTDRSGNRRSGIKNAQSRDNEFFDSDDVEELSAYSGEPEKPKDGFFARLFGKRNNDYLADDGEYEDDYDGDEPTVRADDRRVVNEPRAKAPKKKKGVITYHVPRHKLPDLSRLTPYGAPRRHAQPHAKPPVEVAAPERSAAAKKRPGRKKLRYKFVVPKRELPDLSGCVPLGKVPTRAPRAAAPKVAPAVLPAENDIIPPEELAAIPEERIDYAAPEAVETVVEEIDRHLPEDEDDELELFIEAAQEPELPIAGSAKPLPRVPETAAAGVPRRSEAAVVREPRKPETAAVREPRRKKAAPRHKFAAYRITAEQAHRLTPYTLPPSSAGLGGKSKKRR